VQSVDLQEKQVSYFIVKFNEMELGS